MKKTLLISSFIVTFIAGIALSDLVLYGINQVFGSIFTTKIQLKRELEEYKK